METMHNELHLHCPYCGSADIAVSQITFVIEEEATITGTPKTRHRLDCDHCHTSSWLDVSTERGFVKTLLIKESKAQPEAKE